MASEGAFDVPDPEHDVDVTSVTFQPPKGFEFLGVEVKEQWGNQDSPKPSVTLDSTVVVDPGTGEITVTAPDGGWRIAPGGFRGEFYSSEVYLSFTLRAPDDRMPGSTSGVTFTGTSVPASDGWVATGTTRVWPESDGAGSSGS